MSKDFSSWQNVQPLQGSSLSCTVSCDFNCCHLLPFFPCTVQESAPYINVLLPSEHFPRWLGNLRLLSINSYITSFHQRSIHSANTCVCSEGSFKCLHKQLKTTRSFSVLEKCKTENKNWTESYFSKCEYILLISQYSHWKKAYMYVPNTSLDTRHNTANEVPNSRSILVEKRVYKYVVHPWYYASQKCSEE